MASPSSQTASSSSLAARWRYDDFLSFRGTDTRTGFTDHLYNALEKKGCIVFRDDEKLQKGEKISESLLRAIQESKYAIVVISEHYTFSKWCLNELLEIVECMKKGWLTILPVFYHVDPSDVRNQKGIFGEAFARHTEASEKDKILWGIALKEVGSLAGWHIHNREPGKWSRLWRYEDILYVLKNNTGTDAVESIIFEIDFKQEEEELNFEAFSKMKKLKILVIKRKFLVDSNNVKWIGDPSKLVLSNDLCILEWFRYPLEFLPTNFWPNNLVIFKMIKSRIKQLWGAEKRFDRLRYIDMRWSRNLLGMPEFTTVPNLEHIDASNTLRGRVPSSSVQITVLRFLSICGTGHSNSITISSHISFSGLRSLKSLDLSYCNLFDGTLLDDLVLLSSLEKLFLSGNKFTRISADISRLSSLSHLALNESTNLRALPPKLPLSLRVIHLRDCPSLDTFYDPENLPPSSEKLVDGRLSLDAYYFGYGGTNQRTLHLARPRMMRRTVVIYEVAAWGPSLASEIPVWFKHRSTNLLDASGTVRRYIYFKLDADLYNHTVIWGYALFMIYEAPNPNDCQIGRKKQKIDTAKSSNSGMFPIFVCELQDEEDGEKVPLAFRVPKAPSIGRNGIWVFLNGPCFWRRKRSVKSYSITVSGRNVEVKECKGRIVRKRDFAAYYKILRNNSPLVLDAESLQNIFFGKPIVLP